MDELYDSKTCIQVITLKFWSRVSADFSDFKLDQVTHLSSKANIGKMSVVALSSGSFAVSIGDDEAKIWNLVTVLGESAEQESR